MKTKVFMSLGATLALILAPAWTLSAEDLIKTLTGQEPSQLSTPLRLLALLTVLSLVPSIILMTTCFPRIVIVFSFLRRAMGTQDLPPNQIMIGLALFLTAAVMAPTWQKIYQDSLTPYMEGKMSEEQAFEKSMGPLKSFMLEKTLRKDLRLFVELSHLDELQNKKSAAVDESVMDLPLKVIIPAFLISELKVSFQMGFVLYLPFLIIDLVVSTTLISMGMLVLPPFMISFPLKVLVFVLVDGWNLIVEQLVKSFL